MTQPTARPSSPSSSRSSRPSSTERATKILKDSTIWRIAFEATVCIVAVVCFAIMSWWSFLNTVSFVLPLIGSGVIILNGVAFNLSKIFGFIVQYAPNVLTMAKTIRPPGVNVSEAVGQSELRRYVMWLNIGIVIFNFIDFVSNFGYYLYTIKPTLPSANIAPLWYDAMAFGSAIIATQLEEFAIFTFGMFLSRVALAYSKVSREGVIPTSL